jgi:hypothetical protein
VKNSYLLLKNRRYLLKKAMNNQKLRAIIRNILTEQFQNTSKDAIGETESWKKFYHDGWIQTTNLINEIALALTECEDTAFKNATEKLIQQYLQKIPAIPA